jgi:hypothetical protein
MESMSINRPPTTYAVVAWMITNAIFFAIEVIALNDAVDLNNSILLVLFILSTIGLLSMKKAGAAITLFTLIYAFSFNSFNAIYFSDARLLNGISAFVNLVAIAYMFISIFQSKYR